jgi:hypothetical protein
VDSADLASRAVEIVGNHLAETVALIPGSPAERLHFLIAVRMRQSPDGSAIFGQLERMPNDRTQRLVAAVKLAGLVQQDPRFAADLESAVTQQPAAWGPVNQSFVDNTISGGVSGSAVQANSISNSTIDQSRRKTRISFGGLVLIIALVLGLGATVFVVVNNLVDSHTTAGSALPDVNSGRGNGAAPATTTAGLDPNGGVTLPNQEAPAGGNAAGDCGRAELADLTVSPTQGGINTKITVSGVGYVPNGKVSITFHASPMGSAPTDCHGVFRVTLPIPNRDFFSHFPNQSFTVHATEWSSSGQYQGNGDFDGAQFLLTG